MLLLLQVLESCPWVQPRAVSVLAVVEASGEAATVFTLRTSVRRKSMEAELTKVCSPGNSQKIQTYRAGNSKEGFGTC